MRNRIYVPDYARKHFLTSMWKVWKYGLYCPHGSVVWHIAGNLRVCVVKIWVISKWNDWNQLCFSWIL